MASIAVVGSTNIDMVAYTDQVPERGETVTGKDFAIGFGGKGANQAVMAARLGMLSSKPFAKSSGCPSRSTLTLP